MTKLFVFISNSKKVLIPGVNIRTIFPVSYLLTPKELIIPMALVCLLAQLSSNLKGILDFKEIQQLPSVKFYSKGLMSGYSSLGLTTVYSLSKTLGADLETLSTLNSRERIYFLQALKKSILNEKVNGNIISNYSTFKDPYLLLKFRKGLALQSRSIMVATSIFLPHSLVTGLSIDQVDLNVILNSSRLLWSYLSLPEEEFDFLLKKEAYSYLSLKDLEFTDFFSLPLNVSDSFRIIIFSEFEKFLSLFKGLVFEEDYVLLRSENNLTRLENDFKFIKRLVPNFPNEIFLSSDDLSSDLIRVAVNQRKEHIFNLGNVFKMYQNN